MLGFKDFRCARVILSGIEIMHTIVKGQMVHTGKIEPSAACQFYSLVT
jgi:putative transposase